MRLLKQKSVGISINGSSIRAVVLYGTKKEISLGQFESIALPDGTINGDEIKDYKEIKKALLVLKKKIGFSKAVLSAQKPETDLFREIGVRISWFESPLESSARAIVKNGDKEIFMLVEIGMTGSTVSVFDHGEICYAKDIGINATLLEDVIRRRWGMDLFYEEINRHYVDWHLAGGKKDEIVKSGASKKIKKVLIYGDARDLATLSAYLTTNMRTTVALGNAWVNIVESFDKTIPEMTFDESLGFTPAIGAALKGLEI